MKVRCINNKYNEKYFKIGKEYNVLETVQIEEMGITKYGYSVVADNGYEVVLKENLAEIVKDVQINKNIKIWFNNDKSRNLLRVTEMSREGNMMVIHCDDVNKKESQVMVNWDNVCMIEEY